MDSLSDDGSEDMDIRPSKEQNQLIHVKDDVGVDDAGE
jgi:hypothetical protein